MGDVGQEPSVLLLSTQDVPIGMIVGIGHVVDFCLSANDDMLFLDSVRAEIFCHDESVVENILLIESRKPY